MKKLLSLILVLTLSMTLFASCAEADKALSSTYLNLGEKYLADLNYEQAIVYFDKLLEVEPNNERAYLGAAESYVALDDIDSAIAILEQGVEAVDDPTEIQEMLAELTEKNGVQDEVITDEAAEEVPTFVTTAMYHYNSNGNINSWYEYEYDSSGNQTKSTRYDSDGSTWYWSEYEYDSNGNMVKEVNYNSDGSINYLYENFEYDLNGNEIKEVSYNSDGSVDMWVEWKYDLSGNRTKWILYNSDGSINSWFEYEYDSSGNLMKDSYYDADGSVYSWLEYEYDSDGNRIRYVSYNSDGSIWTSYEYEYTYEYDSTEKITSKTITVYEGDVLYSIEYQSRIN